MRISLRALLLVIGLIAIVLGIIAAGWHRNQALESSVQYCKGLDGNDPGIGGPYYGILQSDLIIGLAGCDLRGKNPDKLSGFRYATRISYLNLSAAKFDRAHMEEFANWPLNSVNLNHSNATNEDVIYLAKNSCVRKIRCSGVNLTAASIKAIDKASPGLVLERE